MTNDEIAEILHTANTHIQILFGEDPSKPWSELPVERKDSVCEAVEKILLGELTRPEDLHASWMLHKEAMGWEYGEVKSEEDKTHPCLVAYEYLPIEQRLKDVVFLVVTKALHEFSRE